MTQEEQRNADYRAGQKEMRDRAQHALQIMGKMAEQLGFGPYSEQIQYLAQRIGKLEITDRKPNKPGSILVQTQEQPDARSNDEIRNDPE